jgi:hypothetical protein
MPLDAKILGFSNRWYMAAMQAADPFMLAPSIQIRIVTPPYFVATKLEASMPCRVTFYLTPSARNGLAFYCAGWRTFRGA